MPISRIFQPVALQSGLMLQLDSHASHHVARVLRREVDDFLTLFNGQGGEFKSIISRIDKKTVTVNILDYLNREVESSLELCLVQGISRGEKMDYTIQKAVELGVTKIIPVFTERSTVKLADDRREKRLEHWQATIISACEQSGRNKIPEILAPQPLVKCWPALQADACFILSPAAKFKLSEFSNLPKKRILLLIGPEGGLSAEEMDQAANLGFLPLNLGPRVLRTETAAVAAITALQCYFGDMS